MVDIARERWNRARHEMIVRWRQILARIEAHDEGGVMNLANVMDEFCEEAMTTRNALAGRPGDSVPGFESPVVTTRCLFCRGFVETGGCLGLLNEINRAVLMGSWGTARRLAEGYITRLEVMDLSTPIDTAPI